MKKYKSKFWTEAESNILRDYYYTVSRHQLYQMLPGASINDILEQVFKLKRQNVKFRGV